MRGLAVLVMIEAHAIDAWTAAPDRQTTGFAWAIIVGGLGAPMFLFLAGVAVPLAAGARERRTHSTRHASMALVRRGGEIFVLAFLFRLQSFLLSPGARPISLLKVDILNIMGPALVAAALVWRFAADSKRRALAYIGLVLLVGLLTPAVRASTWLTPLPDPIEWYFRPSPGHTNFTLFPWAGFLFAGAVLGIALHATPEPREGRVIAAASALGASIAASAYFLSFQPSPFPASSFWTSSPAFFFLRCGILLLIVVASFLWDRRPWRKHWSPLLQFGRTSLFVYWIHVEMVYGVISAPWHRSLSFGQAVTAFVALACLLLVLSIAKTWLMAWWDSRREPHPSLVT
jgi:uncharacterized membrane protein